MDVPAFLKVICARPDYLGQIAHVEELPARTGRFGVPRSPLPTELQDLLAARGIEQLYSHQVEALELARDGRDYVVITGTASGKTLCYNLPILESCLANPAARALYLFPTKALAQDQMKGLLGLLASNPGVHSRITPGVYDGDTPTAQRRRIKAEANLVLSNPDMLHASLLPYHTKWARFFSELRYVVIDEVHTYRGILGAHIACVLRRLQRVCAHYGSQPQFLAASATIANPGELTSRLIGRDVAVIDQDGAPRGSKFFVLWNPAPLGQDHLAQRSATDDAVSLMATAMQFGAQTLAFTRTRQQAELIHRYVQDELRRQQSPLVDRVRAYRGGYLPDERRVIEQQLFNGEIRGVAATNALELGVDIGSLDLTLLVQYPGTIASTWQQAGRSGRRQETSMSVLIAGNDPVDQYLLRHPDYFFSQAPEHAVVDPNNPYVLAKHLKPAAYELPLAIADIGTCFGEMALPVAEGLCQDQQLHRGNSAYFDTGGQNPAHQVSLRHMSDNSFTIVLQKPWKTPPASPHPAQARGTREIFLDRFWQQQYNQSQPHGLPRHQMEQQHDVLAQVDAISAPELIYPQAVYLHHGETYFIRQLDWQGKVAYADRQEMDYYTQAILESDVQVQQLRAENPVLPTIFLGYGSVDVSWKTVAFKKIKFSSRENIGYGEVDLPAQTLPSMAFWLIPHDEINQRLKQVGIQMSEGLCGLRNLIVEALPMIAMCDSRDISGVVDSKNFGKSCIVMYDRYPGGLGYCEKGFQQLPSVVQLCYDMARDCECEDGCPSCVGLPNLRPAIHSDPDLARGYPMPNKVATLKLLDMILGNSAVTIPMNRRAVAG